MLAAALAAVACGGHASPKIKLAIAAQQSPSQLLTYLAAELGYFSECGLQVELVEFPGSAKAMEALLGGSVDVVSGYHEQALQLPVGAPPMQSFVAMTNGLLVALAVSPQAAAGIRSLDQLSGRTVGVTALGSATHLWLNALLLKRNVRPDQVTPVAISTAARAVAAIENGVVSAAVVSDFTVRTLEKKFGSIRILADTRTPSAAREFYGTDQYPGAVLFARQSWMQHNPAGARSLACGINRARTWVQSRSAEDVAARMPASHIGGDPAIYTEVIRQTIAMLTPDGRFTLDGAEAARRLTNSPRAAQDSFTNEFAGAR